MIGGCLCVDEGCDSGPVTFPPSGPQQPGYVPYRPPLRRKRGLSGLAIAAIAVPAVFVVLCGIGLVIAVIRPDQPSGAAQPAPAYRVVSDEDHRITVEVEAMLPTAAYELIVSDLKSKRAEDASYSVAIDCVTGARIGHDNRVIPNGLAHGKFAIGRPAVAPGLTVYPDRKCPDPLPPAIPWLPQEAESAYLHELGQIDPGLTVSDTRAIGRASETCHDILTSRVTGDKLTETVVQRLSGGNATIDGKQAGQAITLMRKHVCPHYDKWRASKATASPAR